MANTSRHHTEPQISFGTLAPAASAESLVLLTQDAELIGTLRAVASGRPIFVVSAEADLAVHLLSDHGAVALIDTASIASSIAELTERLKTQFPDLVLVVAGSAQDQAALTAQIGSGGVYRFLHKPLSEQRVKLFVDAAWRRRGQEHAGIVGLAQTQPVHTLGRKRSYKGVWVSFALVIAAAVGGLLALQWPQSPRPTPARVVAQSPVTEVRATPSPSATVEQEVTPGQPTIEAISTPPTQLPAPQVARTPIIPPPVAPVQAPDKQQQLIERLMSEARNAFAASDSDEGERWMQAAREAGATEEDLGWLHSEAERVRLALRAQSITQLLQQFNNHLAQDRLVQPANDSAKFYLMQLRQTDAVHPATRAAAEALASRLVMEARSSVAKQDFAAARRWLTEARDAGADDSKLATVESEIAQAPAPTIEASRGVTPNKIHHVDPEYPTDARISGASGWVDLDLAVQADGSVGEIVVLGSQPRGLFDKPAIAAARKWRYEPAPSGTQRAERRTKVRIRFELK